MRWRRLEIALYVSLGALLGLGVAAWRGLPPGWPAQAQGPGGPGGGTPKPSGVPVLPNTGSMAPNPGKPAFKGEIGLTVKESKPYWPPTVKAPKGAPNILYIVLDDVGFGQLGCYGGGVKTPNIDKLAKNGVRYTQFQTCALCSPTRSCFLTGRNHHSNAMSCITEGATGYPGSHGHIPLSNGMLSELLTPFGWAAWAIGKWHLTPLEEMSLSGPRTNWPLGRGFERFYGFLGAETNQWYPDLTYDNHFVKPPTTPEQGYHLTVDLVDTAIEFITDNRNVTPEKPFFLYFCTGAAHAPHHSPKEWADKYKGQFDGGWEKYREETFQRQLDMGILPKGTKLPPHDPDVAEWAKLGADEKKLYARMMEVFAGFLSHADHEIGRLLNFLEKTGQLDNTLIFVVSDNGASAEGGPTGSINENLFFNDIPDDLQENLKRLAVLGSPAKYNHYAWGWTWAGNTPFKRWKRETHRGGTSDPLIVHWPKGIKAKGDIRHEFVHAIDLVPTVLDVLGLEPPDQIRGVGQSAIEGVSFKHTFDDPKAKSKHKTQYFEMFAYRAIYHDGWRAVAPWPFQKEITAADLPKIKWELYDLHKDVAEADDVSKQFPDKLQELQELWWSEAGKYGVLPLDARGTARLQDPHPVISEPREDYVYLPGGGEVSGHVAVDVLNKSFSITAEVQIPKDGAEGVLLAQGGRFGGFTLFVKDKKLHFVHNYCGLKEMKVISDTEVPSGKATLKMEFTKTGKEKLGAGGKVAFSINGKGAGSGQLEKTTPLQFSLAGDGLCCGYDGGTPVSADYQGEFRFTATIERVVVHVGKDGVKAPKKPVYD